MHILAEVSDYLAAWQLPVVAVLVVVWIFWGGRLLRSAVRDDVGRKEGQLNRCTVVALLAGLVGLLAGALAGGIAVLIAKKLLVLAIWLALPTVAVVFCLVSYLTVFASFELPAGKVAKVWIKSFGPPLAVAALAAVPSVWIANSNHQQKLIQNASMSNLHRIFRAIGERYRSEPPENLEELVQQNILEAEYLVAERHPRRKIGYFYMPKTLQPPDKPSKTVLACDWKDNLSDGNRVVLFTNGRMEVCDQARFQQILSDEVNKEFAEALAKAEKNLPPG